MGLILLYDLSWRNVMYALGQTLTHDSKTRDLGKKTVASGDEQIGNKSAEKGEGEIATFPTGN